MTKYWFVRRIPRTMTKRKGFNTVWGTLTSTVTLCLILKIPVLVGSENEFCPIKQSESKPASEECGPRVTLKPDDGRYVLYDVNNPEGFNLRRDVYMRMAVFVKKLNEKGGNWTLVLPPWIQMYHWRSNDVKHQNRLPWHYFFDVESLKKYVPVIEFYELLDKLSYRGENLIDQVYVLQHFKDTWTDNKLWEDKWAIEPCLSELPYSKTEEDKFSGPFWNYRNVTAVKVNCVSFQGPASQLHEIFMQTDAQTVMFDHAEVALHDLYGQVEYWKARRSMRFAKHLVDIANNFRRENLNSTDEADKTILPSDWTEEVLLSGATGGPYLGVHLRRNDFLWGRKEEVPSLEYAAHQIKSLLEHLKLKKVFVATDAPKDEFFELTLLLDDFEVYRFKPDLQLKNKIKDGGVAIVDQIICAHATYFTGTHESTFSFRIQEEREILGFDKDTTFNRLCGKIAECVQPTRWSIVF